MDLKIYADRWGEQKKEEKNERNAFGGFIYRACVS